MRTPLPPVASIMTGREANRAAWHGYVRGPRESLTRLPGGYESVANAELIDERYSRAGLSPRGT